AGLLGMYLVLFALVAAGRLARAADEFTYGESWLLDGARQVAHGQGLYGPADQVPMMHVAYTPGYYVVVGVLQWLVGDHGYTVGRSVSLVATLIGAGALAWSLRRMSNATWVGLLGAAVFLTQNLTLLLWGPLHRVDPLALALTLIGMACVTAGRHRAAALLFVLALFTKQSYVVAPIATAISLWPAKRRLAWVVGIVAGLTVVGVLIAQWLTHGRSLLHTVTANRTA